MADFETMPIGTRQTMKETAELLRSYERHHQNSVAAELKKDIWHNPNIVINRTTKAKRNAEAAAKLEALLIQVGVEL